MKTYSLREVAELVLPAEWSDGERWLARRLNRGEIRGYRVGRLWRLTEQQLAELVERYSNDVAIEKASPASSVASAGSVVDGLSRRSRRRLRSAS